MNTKQGCRRLNQVGDTIQMLELCSLYRSYVTSLFSLIAIVVESVSTIFFVLWFLPLVLSSTLPHSAPTSPHFSPMTPVGTTRDCPHSYHPSLPPPLLALVPLHSYLPALRIPHIQVSLLCCVFLTHNLHCILQCQSVLYI